MTTDLRARLRDELTGSLKRRDRAVASALRAAIAAVDNAEAVDPTGIEASEVARRELTADDVVRILTAELDDLVTHADEYDALGQDERAADLRAGAEAMRAILGR